MSKIHWNFEIIKCQQKQSKITAKSTKNWPKIGENVMKFTLISPKCEQNVFFFRLAFFNWKNTRKKTILGASGVEPDLAGERKAHFESDTTMLLAAMRCYLLLFIAMCCFLLLFAVTCCYLLLCAAIRCYLLLWAALAAVCCCMLLVAAICCYLLLLAAICCYLLLLLPQCF